MSYSMECEDGVEILVQPIGSNRISLSLCDQNSGESVGTWMNKQECQQLIEQLMLVCERLQE